MIKKSVAPCTEHLMGLCSYLLCPQLTSGISAATILAQLNHTHPVLVFCPKLSWPCNVALTVCNLKTQGVTNTNPHSLQSALSWGVNAPLFYPLGRQFWSAFCEVPWSVAVCCSLVVHSSEVDNSFVLAFPPFWVHSSQLLTLFPEMAS
jgi:hypothetical protein